MHRMVLCALVIAACEPLPEAPPDHYIASVYREDGRLMANRCELDDRGHATQVCEPVAIDDAPDVTRSPMPVGLDLPAPRARPAPDAAALANAIDASGARRLVAQCRAVHADDDALDADVTLAPSGAIRRLALHGATGALADCAAAALRTTTIAPFDGAPVTVRVSL